MISIRSYTDEDFVMLHRWNAAYGEFGPTREMIPTDSAFILEVDGKPAFFLSMWLTNMNCCYLEGIVSDKSFRGDREACLKAMFDHVEGVAKEKGYNTMIALAYKEPITNMLHKYGFTTTLRNITSSVRRVK